MSLRQSIIQTIFNQATLPTVVPSVQIGTTPPVALVGVASVDKLTHDMGGGEVNHAWRYRPTNPINRLAIVCQGHDNSYASIGIDTVAQKLINAGFDVVLMGMPGYCGNGGSSSHNVYTSLRYFIEPTIAVLNLLAQSFTDVSMIGISGGGWTTTVAAAIDPRIKISCPVAGSLPSSFKPTYDDWEQGALAHVADYQAIYALGCLESGRNQRQCLIRNEPSTLFSFAKYGPNYQQLVVNPINQIQFMNGGGEFSWYEDTSQNLHMISLAAINNAILPLLGVDPGVPFERYIKVQDPAFVRTGSWFFRAETVDGMYHSLTPWVGRAEWRFTDVPNGTYDVFVSWSQHPNRSQFAPFSVLDGSIVKHQSNINQEGTPSGFTAPNGQVMKKLATVAVSSGSCTVALDQIGNASGTDFVVASTARIMQVN